MTAMTVYCIAALLVALVVHAKMAQHDMQLSAAGAQVESVWFRRLTAVILGCAWPMTLIIATITLWVAAFFDAIDDATSALDGAP